MKIVRRFYSVNWLKMSRASATSPLNLCLLKAYTHASRKYRYDTVRVCLK